ncbi:MbnP family protein [Polluticoccus soli]|uniref:MbnP family protein n=1 Tax=Polluticoccus soli TaxID=3034150 RepID=UPI0023E115E8|nr:MbnP family protein [Flavipsychrobacter sp. JY13-12]
MMVGKYRTAVALVGLCVLQSLSAMSQPETKCKLHISVKNVFGKDPLILNDRIYRTPAGDSIFITNYKYYISNITLPTVNGDAVVELDSYHLINEAKPKSKEFDVYLPPGEYSAIRFMIGVDSLHNVSGAQTDALDPINAMFWDWNTGYINAKLEGRLNNAEQTDYSFHIGGFAGSNSTLRWATLRFSKPVTIKAGVETGIALTSNAAEWLKTPNSIELRKMPVVVTEGADAVHIADNYADMFSLSHED